MSFDCAPFSPNARIARFPKAYLTARGPKFLVRTGSMVRPSLQRPRLTSRSWGSLVRIPTRIAKVVILDNATSSVASRYLSQQTDRVYCVAEHTRNCAMPTGVCWCTCNEQGDGIKHDDTYCSNRSKNNRKRKCSRCCHLYDIQGGKHG